MGFHWIYFPQNQKKPWKIVVWRLVSFWKWPRFRYFPGVVVVAAEPLFFLVSCCFPEKKKQHKAQWQKKKRMGFLVHPPKQTWNLKMDPWKRRFLLETIISRFHVNFWGCKILPLPKRNSEFVPKKLLLWGGQRVVFMVWNRCLGPAFDLGVPAVEDWNLSQTQESVWVMKKTYPLGGGNSFRFLGIFIPILGVSWWSNLTVAYFWDGLVQPPTSQSTVPNLRWFQPLTLALISFTW